MGLCPTDAQAGWDRALLQDWDVDGWYWLYWKKEVWAHGSAGGAPGKQRFGDFRDQPLSHGAGTPQRTPAQADFRGIPLIPPTLPPPRWDEGATLAPLVALP